jgi:predicted  nucleic acid-binding Zn-ribbon protein
VKGTHHEVKYRKLEKLRNRLQDAQEQIADLHERRDQHNPTGSEWARLHRRMNTFQDHANHLEERIQRQQDSIAAQEAA